MEQFKSTNRVSKLDNASVSDQADAHNTRLVQNIRVTDPVAPGLLERNPSSENYKTKAITHACKAYRRGYQQANDRLKRADRDLGETVAVIAASLTAVTAVEAVINIAHNKIGLPSIFPFVTFYVYMAALVVILVWGVLRSRNALRRRTQAEKEVDQAKMGIFEFCLGEHWPRMEE